MASVDLQYGHFEHQLRIDRNALDQALIDQPQLIAQVGDVYATLVSHRDGLKDRVELKKAGADINIRNKAKDNDETLTEAMIKAKITTDPAVRATNKEYLDVCREVDRWSSLKQAFSDRGHAMRQLCELYIASYWTTNTVKASTRQQIDEDAIARRRKAMADQREKLRTKRGRE